MPYEEKPASRTTRVVVLVVLWLVVLGPLFVALWYWMGWWFLVLVAPAVWTTWDYLQRGDMFGPVDRASRAGAFLPGGWRDDRRPKS